MADPPSSDDERRLDPVWAAWAAAIGSLSATGLIVHWWRAAEKGHNGGQEQFLLMLASPIIYGIVAAIVTAVLSFTLEQIEEPGIGIGIIVGISAVMALVRGTPTIWEIIVAAFMALFVYGDLLRRAGNRRWPGRR